VNDGVFLFGGRRYEKAYPGVYPVPWAEAQSLRFADMLPHSTVNLVDLPVPACDYRLDIDATHGGDAGEDEYYNVFIWVGFAITSPEEDRKRLSRIRRVFLPCVEQGLLHDPIIARPKRGESTEDGAGFPLSLAGQPNALICEAIAPALAAFRQLARRQIRLFICHASEDKPVALQFAEYVKSHGADVWLDQWEIKVGDSIVQKINDGLQQATHLAVLFSAKSVTKPWVRREMSSALMRQLADNSITLIPLLIEDCEIPAIVRDVRYADCRHDRTGGFAAAVNALLPR